MLRSVGRPGALCCVCLILLLTTSLRGEQPDPEVVPPLSVETIFHPDQRFSYLTDAIPATRWTTADDGTSRLLIRRGEAWQQIDPAAGDASEEADWPGAERLIDQLVSLGDVDPAAARAVVNRWIGDPTRSLDQALLRVGDSLVIAGLTTEPRRIARQAAGWNDPTLSPDHRWVAFVQNNDLYALQIDSGRVLRITDDGSETRLNGRLDWVYQEEIYGRGNFRAFWWSDDSRAIALLRIDNSRVPLFTFTTSEGPHGGTVSERYPKAGDPIPHAELWVARLVDPPVAVAEPASEPDTEPAAVGATGSRPDRHSFPLTPVYTPDRDEERLIVRVGWREGAGELIFQQMNRLQNESTLFRCAVGSTGVGDPEPLLHEHCGQWLEVIGLPTWLTGGDFLWLSDLPSGRRRLWRLAPDGGDRIPLTPDGFDVRGLVSVDQQSGYAWVTGDDRRGSVGQQLYRVALDPNPSAKSADGSDDFRRVTSGDAWHQVSISTDHRWMVDRRSRLHEPWRLTLLGLTDFPADSPADAPGQPRLLQAETLRFPGEPIEPEWFRFATDNGPELPGYVIRPPGVGQPDTPKLPVLIEVYGGPLAPSVRDSWANQRYLLHQYLANEGIAVVVIDNRSSGGRGLADAWSIHRRVGEVETQDVLSAVAWLQNQAWVDPARMAIRGWSFGGFLTLHTMTHSDAFVAGVAGGSVTDWRNYDAIYTERYMGLPEENRAGYDATSPVMAAERMHGRPLLVHGEVDDNVHLANSLQMAAALQQAGKPLELMIYPGSAHGVRGGMPTYHLMRTTIEFLKRELSIDR